MVACFTYLRDALRMHLAFDLIAVNLNNGYCFSIDYKFQMQGVILVVSNA